MSALSEYDVETLIRLFEAWGHPRGNTKKLLRRYYDSAGESIEGVQIARELKERVLVEMGLRSTNIITRRQAADGTVKLLVEVGEHAQGQLPKGKHEDNSLPSSAYRLLPTAYSPLKPQSSHS